MADMNMLELRELVQFLKESGIAEFELDREDQHVRLKFESAFSQPAAAPAVTYAMPAPAHLPGTPAPAVAAHAAAPAAAPTTPPAVEEDTAHVVKSPIVGTFYESSAPGAQPFIKVGDTVEVGQVLCIVEAMKLMNEIESDVAGEVVRIIAKNGSAVEYGQPLFAVKAR
ncbi:acetyl-CoA carboxylase biotin carboxyl carrier protein [Terriglobus aquaticus]|uniref:Biotin carboxyl carrier protein of acetyl-CoA carboxylase n=1 Tax=Terriglobus aquaticus TaxID=940139 RepID=A0ABW9KK57_9BACT|nr:acetyl-CoA carboxylase biotin carboxyl carrier protein [Terriglobus aquaticus]